MAWIQIQVQLDNPGELPVLAGALRAQILCTEWFLSNSNTALARPHLQLLEKPPPALTGTDIPTAVNGFSVAS